MYDVKLPQNMWDLPVTAAVHAFNRTPHKSNDMITLLQKFAPHHSFQVNQMKRFGCVAYINVQRKTGPKFRFEGSGVILVGYTPTAYQLSKPEEGKYYESRDARFNEELIYGNIYKKNDIKDNARRNDNEKRFIEFDKE